jgi:hypothetical protein
MNSAFSRRFNATSAPNLASSILSSYLFFLLRRPVSASNSHYLARRIQGLKSLGPLLEISGNPGLKETAQTLAKLQPANFSRVARELQFRLTLENKELEVPPDYVVAAGQPSPDFLSNVRRVLLLTGPAIGIGDEIILFTLPRLIKAALPNTEIAVMSGYSELWDRVTGIDEKKHYATHRELLEALRGQSALGEFDLTILADFEKPGLAVPVCFEPAIGRYLELSLGAQCATAVDNRTRRIWTMSMPLEVRINYYDVLDQMAEWLNLRPEICDRYSGIVRQQAKPSPDPLRIFVSPFTSKYEPPVIFWSHVLSSLVPHRPLRPIEIVLDPGPNLTTERFSAAVVQSAAMRAAPGVRFTVAHRGESRTLSLEGVFAELESAHVVICADSFAAHAAPQFGCTTLVIAAAGLKNWRTPAEKSFYFDADQGAEELIAAMREVLDAAYGLVENRPAGRSPFGPLCVQLEEATEDLESAIRHTGLSDVNAARCNFLQAYQGLVQALPEWPQDFAGLFRDVDYQSAWRHAVLAPWEEDDPELLRHFRAEVRKWQGTNLRKLLRLACSSCNKAPTHSATSAAQ